MPLYEFKCPSCSFSDEYFHHMSEDKKEHFCPECKEEMQRIFCTNFNIKDGLTGPPPSKVHREKNYRYRRSEMLKKKQKDNHAVQKLVPNVANKEGKPEIFDSWKEASKYAKSEGKNEKSFEPMIQKEKSE